MAASATGSAIIMVNLFDGTRGPIVIGPALKQVLVRVIDGSQKQLLADFYHTSNIRFEVPFFDGPDDRYTVIASADGYLQAGFTPIPASSMAIQTVDLMLLPRDGAFNFADAGWAQLAQTHPQISTFLAHGAADGAAAQDRYERFVEQEPAALACLFNIMTAMAGIHLPAQTPADYLKELVWQDMPADNLFAPAQDRFYAWADKQLLAQVRTATQQGEFAQEMNPNFFHAGATSSYKQSQFGEANVQLTFHEGNTRTIDGVDCVALEPDIDYYKDLGSHALLEVIGNFASGGLTDPKAVYALRWIAGRHAGVADFDPPYTIVG